MKNELIDIHDVYGNKYWYQYGRLHREDGPAVEYTDGSKEWRINGELHREDGPAVEFANGTKIWYQNNFLHRENGPAIEYANDRKEWWLNDEKILSINLLMSKKSIKSIEGRFLDQAFT